jgi:hypothetical protein
MHRAQRNIVNFQALAADLSICAQPRPLSTAPLVELKDARAARRIALEELVRIRNQKPHL